MADLDPDQLFFVLLNERGVEVPLLEVLVEHHSLQELDVGWQTNNFVVVESAVQSVHGLVSIRCGHNELGYHWVVESRDRVALPDSCVDPDFAFNLLWLSKHPDLA